jgi:hypothetical protein
MNKSRLLITAASFFGIVLLSGCQNEGVMLTNPESNSQQAPQFLQFPADQSLMKGLSDTQEITVNNGGQLRIQYTEPNPATGKKAFELDIKLTFDKRSVSNDFQASLQLDAQYLMNQVNLEFGPHGTTFLTPARLEITVKGMDLSGLKQTDKVYLYYDDNGKWARMNGDVKINPSEGKLECKNGELPHFSRYAFGV